MSGAVRRVLMTADAVGGVWTYALDLSRMLGDNGIEVVLAVMGPLPAPAQRAQAAAIPSLRLVERGYRLEWMDEPWADVARAADWLLALERHFAPEFVQLNGFVHATLPFRAPVLVVWDEAKNLETLIRVAQELPWPLRVAGEAERPARRRGDTQVRKGSTRLLGALSRAELAELFGHAAIAAFPAHYEPFGLSVLEAAACGAALVLGDIASLHELWNGAACFVPPEDERALVDALRRLAQDAAERERLGRRARARAERFSLARFAQSYRELYDELAARDRLHPIARPRQRGLRPFASADRARASQLRTSHV